MIKMDNENNSFYFYFCSLCCCTGSPELRVWMYVLYHRIISDWLFMGRVSGEFLFVSCFFYYTYDRHDERHLLFLLKTACDQQQRHG